MKMNGAKGRTIPRAQDSALLSIKGSENNKCIEGNVSKFFKLWNNSSIMKAKHAPPDSVTTSSSSVIRLLNSPCIS